jgi:adenylate kinase family enzyme
MRVAVMGTSGAGKSTLARMLSDRLACPLLELDSVYHQANWTPLPDDEMRSRVEAFTAGDAWVVDGNYSRFTASVRARATDVVWIDPPKAVVMAQVIYRSAARVLDQQELWNGNRERLRAWIDPGHPIRWAWRTFHDTRQKYVALFDSVELAHARKHRLRNRAQIRAFLGSLS